MKQLFKIILAVVITALLVGGFIYYLVNRSAQSEIKKLESQIEELKSSDRASTDSQSGVKELKEVSQQSINWSIRSKVPISWSVYKNPQNEGFENYDQAINHRPWLSIGEDDISFGDINWTQVDLRILAGDLVDQTVKNVRNNNATLGSEKIAGELAKVVSYPLPKNGVATKEKSGCKYYIFNKNLGAGPDLDFTVVIYKQAQMDSEFESGFEAFINNLNIGEGIISDS